MGSNEEPQNLRDRNRNEGLREIFLFSNGQQDSPPRKHSVSVNEPWGVTLKMISTAQRGSKPTVELYTIDGKRIEGPMELSDGAAYVAVEPPQTFVPAGYHDYLMKASRSREKRQGRIPESNFLATPVKIDSVEKLREESEEATNTKTIQGAILLPTSVIVANEQNGISGKVPPDTLRNVKAIKQPSILKATQNKHNFLSHRDSIKTKNITKDNNVPPVNKKVRKTSKIDAIKKKFESPFTNDMENIIAPTKSNSIVREIAGDEAFNTRLASHNLEHVNPNDLQKQTGIESLSNNNIQRLYAERNLIVDSSKITPSAVIQENILSRSRHAADYKEVWKTESNSNITTDFLDEFSQTKTVLIGSPTGAAENILTINVKCGNMVNLKLDLQFKNESNTMVETPHNENTMKSTVKTPKSELPTQDIDVVVAKNRQEAPTLTEVELSFEPIHHIPKHYAAGCEYNCCSSSRNTEPFVFVNVNYNDTGFILLPLRKQNENNERCNSELEIHHHSKGKVQENHMLPGTKNNTVQSDEDDDFIPEISEQGYPNQNKQRPRDNTQQSHKIKIVVGLPEHGNPSQSNQNTRDNEQLDEIATVPDVYEKGYQIQSKPGTGQNIKQSEEINIVPDLSNQGNSMQSRPRFRENTAQSDDIKIVPEVPEQNNNVIYDLIPKDQSKRVGIMEENKECNCCETCTSQNQTTTCSCGEIGELTRPVCDNQQPVTSSSVLEQCTTVTNVSTFRDAFTQTVWNGTVLEARPRDDGSYEFHMPTLETLKRYNAL